MDNQPTNQKQIITAIKAEAYSGPLPRPEDLAKFEATTPGAADRIIAMAENQLAHRQYLEKKSLDMQVVATMSGILSALIIGLASIVACVIITLNGNTTAGLGAMFMGIASLVGVYIYGKKNINTKSRPS